MSSLWCGTLWTKRQDCYQLIKQVWQKFLNNLKIIYLNPDNQAILRVVLILLKNKKKREKYFKKRLLISALKQKKNLKILLKIQLLRSLMLLKQKPFFGFLIKATQQFIKKFTIELLANRQNFFISR